MSSESGLETCHRLGPQSSFNDFTSLCILLLLDVCLQWGLHADLHKKMEREAPLLDILVAKPAIKLLLCPNHALLGF